MPTRLRRSHRIEALRTRGVLNPHPERLRDALFEDDPFFDPHDLVQVRYEMLRRTRIDDWTVTRAAEEYGLSRPSFYAVRESFERDGLPGLVPRKRGSRHARKLTDDILDYIVALRAGEVCTDQRTLVVRIRERFGVRVHPRSIERALERREKKLR